MLGTPLILYVLFLYVLFSPPKLGGRFGYFLFFSAPGRGRGESGATGREGGRFCIENPRKGGVS